MALFQNFMCIGLRCQKHIFPKLYVYWFTALETYFYRSNDTRCVSYGEYYPNNFYFPRSFWGTQFRLVQSRPRSTFPVCLEGEMNHCSQGQQTRLLVTGPLQLSLWLVMNIYESNGCQSLGHCGFTFGLTRTSCHRD